MNEWGHDGSYLWCSGVDQLVAINDLLLLVVFHNRIKAGKKESAIDNEENNTVTDNK